MPYYLYLMRKYFIFVVCICVAACSIWWFFYPHSESTVPISTPTTLKVGNAALYPNPALTPGDTLTRDQNIVCQPTYYRQTKDVSDEIKKNVYKSYSVRYSSASAAYELDRFIPIELGGSNDIKNLWPEAMGTSTGYKQKNAVEDYLHAQVCTHQMTLREAQQKIVEDWYAVYLSIAH